MGITWHNCDLHSTYHHEVPIALVNIRWLPTSSRNTRQIRLRHWSFAPITPAFLKVAHTQFFWRRQVKLSLRNPNNCSFAFKKLLAGNQSAVSQQIGNLQPAALLWGERLSKDAHERKEHFTGIFFLFTWPYLSIPRTKLHECTINDHRTFN